ncbi:ogr/Delta-like zinc finger family protein [Acinetobacter sp. ULE_I010]|uniref:ogr/Delta-like zinc finger family protein n=1 Tax=Acinetobacter sp. ULE_I010 TaxID=3373065 RepID=UPI003AF6F529
MAKQYCFKCPHCGSSLPVRSSEMESPILKRLYLQCSNFDCSFSAQAFLEIKYQLSPSGTPNPEIHIPVSIKKEAPRV